MDLMVEDLVEIIKKHLSPDLLKKEYREENKNNPMFGHCYVATETLFHLINQYSDHSLLLNFRPYWGKDERGITYWWLQNDSNHELNILDVTKDQYYQNGKEPPYQNGRKGAFLTKYASNRALTLLQRVKTELNEKGIEKIY